MWECTECGTQNDVDPAAEVEQLLDCLECGAEFEIESLDPLELKMVHGAQDDPLPESEGDDEAEDADDEQEAWVG